MQFQRRELKLVTVSLEVGTTMIFILVQLFYFDLDTVERQAIEYAIMATLGTMAAVNVVMTVYTTYKEFRRVFAKAKALWSQHTLAHNLSHPHQSILL